MSDVILVYSDTHIGTPETLSELELNPDYSLCYKFLDIAKEINPDFTICCGDFTELVWDGEICFEPIPQLRQITDVFLAGNHDPRGQLEYYKDGFHFLHGHQWERATDGFIERLHLKARNRKEFVVIGHTHSPVLEKKFMDVGSLTLNGSYGIIINGVAFLNFIGG